MRILLTLIVLAILLPVFVWILHSLTIHYGIHANKYSLLDLAFWGGLITWAQLTKVRLPFFASFSHAYLFSMSAILLFPPWLAPILVAFFFVNPNMRARNYTWYKDLFNRLQTGLSVALAALVYWSVTIYLPIQMAGYDATQAFAIIAASATSFTVNISLVSLVVNLSTGLPFREIWFHNFGWVLASYLIMSPVVLLLARLYTASPPLLGNWGGWSVILFLIPLYYARFHWDEVVKLQEAFNKTVDLLSNTIDARDSHTFLHSERVTAIASALARAYGLDTAQVQAIEKGSRIHDIGKINVPDAILFKPGPLTQEEYEIVKKHPVYGVRLLEPAADYLGDTFDIIKYHHERWDSRGYPEGLAGQEIPLWARIVGLADAYEVMTAGRPYQKAKSPEDALREIEDLAGIQFDPGLVKIFRRIWESNPSWRNREVFLRLYSSKVPSLVSSLQPPLGPGSGTSRKSS